MPGHTNIAIISVCVDSTARGHLTYIHQHLAQRYGAQPSRSAVIRAALDLYARDLAGRAGDQLPAVA